MLFVVNHNPALGLGADALGNATSVLDSLGLDYRVWVGRYSEEAHLRHKLQVGPTGEEVAARGGRRGRGSLRGDRVAVR